MLVALATEHGNQYHLGQGECNPSVERLGVTSIQLALAAVLYVIGPLVIALLQPVVTASILLVLLPLLWAYAILWGLIGFGIALFITVPPAAILTAFIVPAAAFSYPFSLAITPLVWYAVAPIAYLLVWSKRLPSQTKVVENVQHLRERFNAILAAITAVSFISLEDAGLPAALAEAR